MALRSFMTQVRLGPDYWQWLPANRMTTKAMQAKCYAALNIRPEEPAPTFAEEHQIRAAIEELAHQRSRSLRHLGDMLNWDSLNRLYDSPSLASIFFERLLSEYQQEPRLCQALSDGCEVARYWQIAVELPLMEIPRNCVIGEHTNEYVTMRSLLNRNYHEAQTTLKTIEELQQTYLQIPHLELK